VPDRFTAEWNESKHAQLLASYAPVALGHPINILFKVDEERRGRPQMDLFVAPPPESRDNKIDTVTSSNLQLSARYTFQNFVIGKSNELAAAAAQAAAASPGKVYNPLFLYGQTGLGKTHLMQAIAHEILSKFPDLRLCFVATEHFTNELVTAIQTRTTAAFRRRYREVDLLLVDDVHFLKAYRSNTGRVFPHIQCTLRSWTSNRPNQ
jgi:ATPase involved in DNA replication initiation